MDYRLDVDDLIARLKSNPRNNYGFIYGVMKGATLANAAFTLTLFWADTSLLSVLSILFWITSFTAMILTYTSTDVGTIVANFRLSWLDTVFPFSLAVLEFMLFSVLQTAQSSAYWYTLFAVYGICITIILYNVARRVRPDDYESERLRQFVKETFVTQQNKDMKRTMLLSMFAALCAFFQWLNIYPLPQPLSWIPPILIIIVLIIGIRGQEYVREQIDQFVNTHSQSRR